MHIRDEQKGALFLLVIVLILVVAGVFVSLSLRHDTVAENLENDQVIRTLFVMESEKNKMLFSQVLVYYPVSKKSLIVNIPGNTGSIWASLGRVDRIDSIYTEKGIDAFKGEVEKLLDMKIPFYTVVNLKNFCILGDMLGGLHIFVPMPVDSLSASGDRWLLPSGAVALDGDKVETYLTYRLPEDTDADVQERYQNIMVSFFSALSEHKSAVFMKHNFPSYAEYMTSNVDSKDFYKLLSVISEMDTEYIIKQTVTGQMRTVGKEKLLFPLNNGEFIKEAVKQTTTMLVSAGNTMASRIYVLEIQNGTPTQGLAHNASILFQNASYDVLSAVNADTTDVESTVIIDHIGNKDAAKMVGDFIHCTNIKEEEVKPETAGNDTAADVDFTVILGKDFDGRYVHPLSK